MHARPPKYKGIPLEAIQRRRSHISMTHYCLPETIQTVIEMGRLPVCPEDESREVVLVLFEIASAVVHALREFFADCIDAVEGVEHVWSRLMLAQCSFFSDIYVLEVILSIARQSSKIWFERRRFFFGHCGKLSCCRCVSAGWVVVTGNCRTHRVAKCAMRHLHQVQVVRRILVHHRLS